MRELATEHSRVPVHTAWIDRLAIDLAGTERELAAAQKTYETAAGHKPSDAVKWEPALRDGRSRETFVSVVLLAAAAITFAAVLALNS